MDDFLLQPTSRAVRVQLVCAAFPPFGKGGGPVTSEFIARGLVAAGHTVEVVTASESPLDENRDGYRVVSIGSPNIYANYWIKHPVWQRAVWHLVENFNPRAYFRVRRAIRRFAPDMVMTVSIENVNVASWLAAKHEGLQILHFLQSYFLLCWRGSLFRNGKKCFGRCRSCRLLSAGKVWQTTHVKYVAGESQFVVDKHLECGLFSNANIFVVPTPVSPTTESALMLSSRPKISTLTIGYIGNISREKGIFTLAYAACALTKRYGNAVRFVIAGSGAPELMEELEAQFPQQNTVFLGWTRPEDFYARVDLVVVPSLWDEPFGRVNIEPLGYGIPVIAARSGGLPENVEDGVSGRIFTPGDHDELTTILSEFVSNRGALAVLSRGAAERARAYTFSSFAKKLDEIVQIVAAGSSPRLID